MEENAKSPFQAAVQPGLIIGLVSLTITYVIYFINSGLLASGWFGLVMIVLFFALIIYFGKQYRSELGGFMSFGTAFNFSFITMIISGIIGLLGQIILFQVIDPSLPEVLAEKTLESTLEMMESFGASPDSMSTEQLDEIKETTLSNFTALGQIKNFGFGLIAYAIVSLILGAILKKRDKSLDY
ncbi:DUF4199 domain-containing protein [Algoriphagus hitonicola]|uniref:DUF4199 domain-containing protein n=1 Tax=Algoriphagus hitonicola TaxID=435880 RepID=A0A1I2XYY7_9BACT|nr:DUF4199 domain-containing protein [Algoriphagus hitonicola]SFH17281.1 Protein of unknown function [Algoriphagus hitonicola]